MIKKTADKFLNGFLVGLVSIVCCEVVIKTINYFLVEETGNESLAARLHLITLAVNIILFRFMVVKWNKQEAGKGLFFAIFISTLTFLLNMKYKFLTF